MGHKRIEAICADCGKIFNPLAYEVSRGKGKYCSQNCARPKGKRHFLYKGTNIYETRKNYKLRYPERHNAHQKVSNAIRRGKLLKENCEKCGSDNVEAHHDDYSKPLDVRWLCRKHHIEEDKKIGTRTGDFK